MATHVAPLLFAALLVAVAAAGCTTGADPLTSLPMADLPTVAVGDERVAGNAPIRWDGRELVGSPSRMQPPLAEPGHRPCINETCPMLDLPCGDSNCDRLSITVDGSALARDQSDLEVSIRWPSDFSQAMVLTVLGPNGNVIGQDRRDDVIGSTAASVIVPRPDAGTYTAVIVAETGRGVYQGVVQLEPRVPLLPLRDLLPDLVVLPPTDLTLQTPPTSISYVPAVSPEGTAVLTGPFGSVGCAPEEAAAGARKCLRFTNAVGNIGEGPLDVHLSLADGATYAAGGSFVQRVHRSDGTWTQAPGGPAEFHAFHAHWHDAAANRYVVYEFDEAAGARGSLVGEGRKAGVCFADIGLVDLGLPHTAAGRSHGYECFAPTDGAPRVGGNPMGAGPSGGAPEWAMRLDSNWYDSYPWILTDQYVDLAGAPDGVYLLCTEVNQTHILLETDLTNNEGCATFRLTGNDIAVLSAEPYHKMPATAMGN